MDREFVIEVPEGCTATELIAAWEGHPAVKLAGGPVWTLGHDGDTCPVHEAV